MSHHYVEEYDGGFDGERGCLILCPRERITIGCPICSDVTTVDKERFAAAIILLNNPPICSRCGVPYQPVPTISPQMDMSR